MNIIKFLFINVLIFWIFFFVFKPWKKNKTQSVLLLEHKEYYIDYSNNESLQYLTGSSIVNSDVYAMLWNKYDLWDQLKVYTLNTVVQYNNKNYGCIKEITNPSSSTPTPLSDTSSWQEIGSIITNWYLYLENVSQINSYIINYEFPVSCYVHNTSYNAPLSIRNEPFFDLNIDQLNSVPYFFDTQDTYDQWNFVFIQTTDLNKKIILDTTNPLGNKLKIELCTYSNTLVTVTINQNEYFDYVTGNYISITGTTDNNINKVWQITVISENTFTFTVPGLSGSGTVSNTNSKSQLMKGYVGFDIPPSQSVKLDFHVSKTLYNGKLYKRGVIYVT